MFSVLTAAAAAVADRAAERRGGLAWGRWGARPSLPLPFSPPLDSLGVCSAWFAGVARELGAVIPQAACKVVLGNS